MVYKLIESLVENFSEVFSKMKAIISKVSFTLIMSAILSFSDVSAQCVYPIHNVVIGSPGNYLSWISSGSSTTGGTRSRIVQIGTTPDIYMRITWVARSSSSVTLGSWDYTGGGYGDSWQPTINFPRSTSATDTSWAEFLVEFASKNGAGANSFDNNPYTFPCLAATIIDIDGSGNSSGSNSFREMVCVSAPSMPYGIVGSSVTSGTVGNWIVNVSGYAVFNNIDSTQHAAQVQMNFTNVQTYSIRVGVIGTRSANSTNRQNSFWFLPFGTLTTPLPVVYTRQNLFNSSTEIIYYWTTSQETNNHHFDIEKSTDGVFWAKIGEQKGAGTSYENNDYSFVDKHPIQGVNLYRLKQVDIDGNYEYSPIQSSYWDTPEFDVQIYPNPTNDKIHIAGVVNADMKIVSLSTGKVVINKKVTDEVSLSELPSGIYYIELSNGVGFDNRVVREKIIKQ